MRRPGHVADPRARIAAMLRRDPARRRVLRATAWLGLPDCWVGAGFVRDAVWDRLHGLEARPPAGDVDVLWFSSARAGAGWDRRLEKRLGRRLPGPVWSVKNQARMHRRNRDRPYRSVAAAVRRWPETATAVAVRQRPGGAVEVLAPLGLGDLFALRLRPGPAFRGPRAAVFAGRVADKGWLARYPRLRAVGRRSGHAALGRGEDPC